MNINGLSKRVLLVILDGLGISENRVKNAVYDAQTPCLDKLLKDYPNTLIEAGGTSVGLPKGVVGNSEVGHMNLGAGRPVRQDLVRINESIAKGTYKDQPALLEFMKKAKMGSGRVHLLGLLSDGGVHSDMTHIEETIKILGDAHLEVYLHAFMDGRDTPRHSGETYIRSLQASSKFHFASMQGRSFGMDRDRRWDKIHDCYKTFIGQGCIEKTNPSAYLAREYENGRYDEFVFPVLFHSDYAMTGDDSVFFINFRPDRAIELTLALNDPAFEMFERPWMPKNYLCMTPYVPDELDLPILFDKEKVSGGLSEYLSNLGLNQYKIAETEKYAHVTFFFNGGERKPFPGEEHVLIPSPKDVATYDQRPEMSALEVTDRLIKALKNKDTAFYLANYANADMVGHTGNYNAALKAVATLDRCLERLMKICEEEDMAMVVTADHGNSDEMVHPDGEPHTSHTNAPVPFILFHPRLQNRPWPTKEGSYSLKDVAPTVLKIMGKKLPSSFTGRSVF